MRVLNDACDRAANTFRKLMLALAEYRRPPRSDAFVSIKQANVAGQQVVHNAAAEAGQQAQAEKVQNASNEQGFGQSPAQLPVIPEGLGGAAGIGSQKSAVGGQHRAKDLAGKGTIADQQPEARRPSSS